MNQPFIQTATYGTVYIHCLTPFVMLLIPEKGTTAVHGCHRGQLPLPYLKIFFETAIFFKRLFDKLGESTSL